MKALIIDTDSRSVKRITKLFNQGWAGSDIVSTADKEASIKLIKEAAPDIVILEIALPHIDEGFAILSLIRSFSDVPLIVLTYLNDKKNLVRALSLGADAYISKSAYSEEIWARIKAVLRRCRKS